MVYLNFFLQFAQLVQCILCSAVRAGYFASWTEVSKDKDWVTEVVVKDREGTDVSVKGDRAGVDGLGIMITGGCVTGSVGGISSSSSAIGSLAVSSD